MDKARNEQGIVGSEFHKPPGGGGSRPSSSMSNRSGQPNDVREIKKLDLFSYINKGLLLFWQLNLKLLRFTVTLRLS